MASRPEYQRFSRAPGTAVRSDTGGRQQPPPYGRDQQGPLPYGQRSVTDFHDSFMTSAATPFSTSPPRQDNRDYQTVRFLPPGGLPINSPEPSLPYIRSAFGSTEQPHVFERTESQYSFPSSYGADFYGSDPDTPGLRDGFDLPEEPSRRRRGGGGGSDDRGRGSQRYQTQRRPSNRDIFDGPHQLLPLPSPTTVAAQERELPHLPTNLDVQEQDDILNQVNDTLSKCAFDFVAKYQFPIPIEPDKRQVRVPQDREWTEWVYLLKRLATKRRIPYRVLYNNQIKQLTTVLENSLEMRHAAKHQSRPLKDDRNVLQLISAGIQVAKILKDASAMEYLDRLYVRTEMLIQERRDRNRRAFQT